MMRALAVVAGIATAARPAVAERGAPIRLALRDAIAIAVAENPRLGIATMALTAADADVVTASGAYDATLEAKVGATSARNDPNASPFAQELELDRLASTVAIVKRMLHGESLTVRVSGSYARSTDLFPTQSARQIVAQTTFSPRVELEWNEPLIGGRRAGAAEHRGLVATADAAASERAVEAARVVRDVERAYWQLYLAERAVAIGHAGIASAENQLALVRSEIAHGSRPRIASAEVEDELARRKEDALIAEGAVVERSLDLSRALGRPPSGDLRAGDVPPEGWRAPSAETVTVAIARSPAIAAAIARGDAAAAAVDRAADETGWRVDAYTTASFASESGGVTDALTQAAGYGGITAELGVKVRAPLGGRTRAGTLDRARAMLVRSRMQVVDAQAEIAAAATRELNRIDVAAERRTALARSIELAETNLSAERARWERGDATSFEVLRRQAALADVQLRAERAIVDALDARAGLEALTGALLARHGVELR
jgi:outer membrane protein